MSYIFFIIMLSILYIWNNRSDSIWCKNRVISTFGHLNNQAIQDNQFTGKFYEDACRIEAHISLKASSDLAKINPSLLHTKNVDPINLPPPL